MNREQRRAAGKGQSEERINITGIVVHFEGGQYVNLDTNKVQLVDKQTGRPVFDEVLEPVAGQLESATNPVAGDQNAYDQEPMIKNTDEYTVQFDTPEGKMEYVKSGNWSGVRKAK